MIRLCPRPFQARCSRRDSNWMSILAPSSTQRGRLFIFWAYQPASNGYSRKMSLATLIFLKTQSATGILFAMLCQKISTQLSLDVGAVASVGNLNQKQRLMLLVVMANLAADRKRHNYKVQQDWKKSHRDRVRELDRQNYERTKVLKGRPPKMTPDEKLVRRKSQRKHRQPKLNAAERLRAKNDIQFCLARRLRASMRCALKRAHAKKAYDTMTLTGCSLEDLVKHLESQFLPGMTWDNRNLWHVDHKRPLASFDLQDSEQHKIAGNWTNLQPLWAWDNQHKSDRIQ